MCNDDFFLGTNNSISAVCIGEYSGVTRTLHLEKCKKIFWHRGKPPKDHTVTRIVKSRLNLPIFAAFCIISTLGILLAMTFLTINIKFRNER